MCIGLVASVAGRADAGQMGFVYALQQVNGGANQIHGFRIDEASGALTPLAGFPMASGGTGTTGGTTEHLAYFNGKLFVVNNGSDTLSVFSVNTATGAVVAMSYSPVALGTGNWACVAVHPNGSPVVVGNASGGLASFVVTNLAATPAAGSPFATGAASPFSCRFAQGGSNVYTGGNTGNHIAGFSVNTSSGVLTPLAGSTFDSGAPNTLAFASDDSGRLFAATLNVSEVRVFTTSGGTLTPATNSPFASGITGGAQGLLHPGGFYMVADRTGNTVGVFKITGAGSATTLAPVSGSPFPGSGTGTSVIALTQTGGHLVAGHAASRNLTVFGVNGSSGALAHLGTQPPNTLGATGNITGVAFAPGDAGFVYTVTQVNGDQNQIYGYRINPSTGGLTLLPGFPMAAGGTGSSLFNAQLMAYRNGRLYVLNDGSDTLSAFKVNRSTGALTHMVFSTIGVTSGNLGCLAVHPSGSPLVFGHGATVTSLDIGATTAAPAPGSPFGTAANAFSCAFSQDGNYLYTGGNSGSTISGFSVNAGTGVLAELPGSPFSAAGSAGPNSYATDSTGRLFTADGGVPSTLRVFTTASGVPSAVAGNPFGSDGLNFGADGLLDPRGAFYRVAGRNSNAVGVFQITGSGPSTTVDSIFGSPFATGGAGTTALAQTTNGAFLVAANGTSRSLTVFQANPATGKLTTAVQQLANNLGLTGWTNSVTFVPAIAPFNDDPLTSMPALSRVIKTSHITELRERIDAARAQYGLAPYSYSTPTLTAGATVIQAAHINDLRLALADVYNVAGMTPPTYTDLALGSGTITVKAAHIMELRAAVIAIE